MQPSSTTPQPRREVPPASVSDQLVVTSQRRARGTAGYASPDQEEPFEAGMFAEPMSVRWARRLVTIPGVFIITAIYALILPVALLYGAIRDGLRKRKGLPLIRFHLFMFRIFAHHCVGLGILASNYVRGPFTSIEQRRKTNLDTEIDFIPKAIGIAESVYGMEIEIDNIEACKGGPVFLFSRHASILDTIMPIKILGQAHGMGMRIVQKNELLWNPIVDVASSRMPRAFIKRGTGNVEGPIANMLHLLRGITNNEAMVVFPEGSRFSEKKKKKIIEKIAQRNPEAAARAAELQSVLPVRPAGCQALLEARPDIDVVFMAHTGLEGANRLEDFLAGALYKRKLRMNFWRVPASQIPADPDERLSWLEAEWRKMDQWIVENRDPSDA